MAKQDKGGGARKYERNRVSCTAYKNSRTQEQNQVRRLLRDHKRRVRLAIRTGCAVRAPRGWEAAMQRCNALLDNSTMKRLYREAGVAM